MTNSTPLSPQAQAVLDAVRDNYEPYWDMQDLIAASLRAAADQIAPVENELIDDCWYEKKNPVRDQLLAIADELEGGIG